MVGSSVSGRSPEFARGEPDCQHARVLESSVIDEIDGLLAETDLDRKLDRAAALAEARHDVGRATVLTAPPRPRRPERPAHWQLHSADEVPRRPRLTSERGRYLLVHSVAHIEVSAVELALMAVADFPDREPAYYRDMLKIAGEEVAHARMLMRRLEELGGSLGTDPVHLGLWETAVEYRDVKDRLAVVPRILEARGLDVSDALRRRLRGAGDEASAQALDIIYRDEIGHVALGGKWYQRCCEREGLDAEAHFLTLVERFRPGRPVAVDVEGRRRAGFSDREIEALSTPPSGPGRR